MAQINIYKEKSCIQENDTCSFIHMFIFHNQTEGLVFKIISSYEEGTSVLEQISEMNEEAIAKSADALLIRDTQRSHSEVLSRVSCITYNFF